MCDHVHSQITNRALFENPTAAFRPSAYWFWHSIPDEATCRAQLADFRAKGIGTILIQARLSLPRENYLSPAYLAAYRLAAHIAGDLGLKLGIYDDYNWISGHAGGRTVDGCDALRERHMFWSSKSSSEGSITGIHPPFVETMGPDILRWQYEAGKVEWCDWTVEAAVLHPLSGIENLDAVSDVTAQTNITARDAVSCSYAFDGHVKAGEALTVFISARSSTSRLINYLLPEAAERFIDVGLNPLLTALEGLLLDPAGFVFYDQPAAGFYRWDQISGDLGNSLLFASALQETTVQKTGAPFAKILLALLQNIGHDTLRLRAQFYAGYSALMNEAFFGTLRRWSDVHGILLTGHEILPHIASWSLNGGFTSIDPRVAPAVDFFGIDAYRHETAVDSNNFSAQLAPKLGDSVARSNGRSRCMVETYASAERTPRRAAGQWELTLETARAQAIRLHCLGMRQFIWHGVYQTDGCDGEPALFVNPRFDFAPGINFEPWWSYHDLFADETARISAFIEPAKPHTPIAILYPLYTAFAQGPRHGHATHIGAWCEHLLTQGCDFMFVSEADLAGATIEDGKLMASGLVFDAVVLPCVTVLETVNTLRALEAFKTAGGAIWSSGKRVSVICDNGAPVTFPEISTHIEGHPESRDIATLVSSLPSCGPQIKSRSGGKPWRWIGYEADGWWRLVLFNDGSDDLEVEISYGRGFEYEEWSPADGAIHAAVMREWSLATLQPHEVLCIRVRKPLAAVAGQGAVQTVRIISAAAETVLLEGGWSFSPGHDGDFQSISVDAGWETQGFADFSGTGIYRCQLKIATQADWLLELPKVETAVTAFLDGREIGRRAWRPYRFALGTLSPGTHRLELHVANTAANRYYSNTPYLGGTADKSGLTAAPKLIPLSS
ncbi:carbohydrate-binding protein [Pararhizobium polonicum]|uniref:Carbohydrate-binding protein n=1 Tax=Pararhizobium polonicum TaxID=1612624 RepID=A0A1C7NWX3_9HYPH|nr:carbohydrate-binding protein [Pararhizobium polonicum]OBZ93491.1 carbohydrate-binding protein [Pararhizobium polonicum]